MQTLEARMKPKQGKILMDNSRFLVVVCGRRFGKTTTLLNKTFKNACAVRGMHGYFAPTHKQAKLISWKILKALVPAHYRSAAPNESELFIPLKNGSEIRLFGMKEAAGNLGVKLASALLDEYDQMDKGQVEDVIRPAVADMQGPIYYCGTPDSSRGQIKDLYHQVLAEKKEGKRQNWGVYHHTSLEGGYIPEEEIELARAEMDERTFRQNFLASFESAEGKVYYSFDFDTHVQITAEYNPKLPIRMCWDFNVDPFCVSFAQAYPIVDRITKKVLRHNVQVFDEMVIRNSNTPEMCREFLNKPWIKNHTSGLYVYGDASGSSRSTKSSLSDYQIIQDSLKNINGFDLRIKAANPDVKDRTAAVNSILKTFDGQIHTTINPRCKWLIKDLMDVTRKPGTNEIDKSNPDRTHSSDGFGYFVEYEYPVVKGFLN